MTVQDDPPHWNVGKRMRAPMELPCVLASEPRRETLRFEPPAVTVKEYVAPLTQSLLAMVNAGRGAPEVK